MSTEPDMGRQHEHVGTEYALKDVGRLLHRCWRLGAASPAVRLILLDPGQDPIELTTGDSCVAYTAAPIWQPGIGGLSDGDLGRAIEVSHPTTFPEEKDTCQGHAVGVSAARDISTGAIGLTVPRAVVTSKGRQQAQLRTAPASHDGCPKFAWV